MKQINRIQQIRFISIKIILILACCLLCILSGCSISSDSYSNNIITSNNSYYVEDKLNTLTISNKLEKSQFQNLKSNTNTSEPLLLFDNYYLYDDVYIELDSDTYSLTDKVLNISLINNTDNNVYGDRDFQLEICLENTWYIIPPVNYNIIDIIDEFPPGKYLRKLNLSEIDVNFIAGKYRIIKRYSIDSLDGTIISFFNFKLEE